MFFYIGSNCNLLNRVSDNLFLDDGWSVIGNTYFKGYSTECILKDRLNDIINGYQPNGIYCLIKDNKVYHSKRKSFPIYSDESYITNIQGNSFYPSNIETYTNKTYYTFNQAVYNIKNILIENITGFLKHNDVQLNLKVTGGIDSVTLLALLEFLNIPYNLHVTDRDISATTLHEWLRIDSEYQSNLIEVVRKRYWGYNIYDFKKNVNWLITGFMGDEALLRGPHQIVMLINFKGKILKDLLQENHYHYYYFQRSKNGFYTELMQEETNPKNKIFQTFINDYQFWHLDNNYGFCPYDDVRILGTVLEMDDDDILLNGLDATIQKQIIQETNPYAFTLLDSYKNSPKYARVNLLKNLDVNKLKNCKSLTVK